jgi:pyruvate/oxaloacetate carboxyltransferase
MKEIKFIDQTIRDAQQSLWGMLMSTDMITPIAPVMDEVGYHEIATNGSNGFVVEVRYFDEDPWERIRTVSKLMPKTPLRGSFMTAALASFDINTPRDIIDLWIKRNVANGIKSFWVCDYQSDMERFYYFAKTTKNEGARCVPSLMYTESPFHTVEHWAKKTRLIAELGDVVDAIMVEDASGILTPERTQILISTIKENANGIPIEFHSHCNAGVAPLCYLEAVKAGAEFLHTAVAPLANGTSLPNIENIVKNVRHLGYTVNIDDAALETVTSHFRKVALENGLPTGVPEEYDLFHFEHQVPGGMMTNLTRQLREMKMEHRIDEFLAEIVQVRKDFGYPIMATPFSQIVGTQAVENVLLGERYKRVLDESVKYLMGHYGELVGPADPNLMDRILNSPETQKIVEWKPEGRTKPLAELRDEIGHDYSDDEFLLRVLIPGLTKKPGEGNNSRKKKPSVVAAEKTNPVGIMSGLPAAFAIDVDGETFNVKIRPLDSGNGEGRDVMDASSTSRKPKEIPPGAILSSMAGLVVSINVTENQAVSLGDALATTEAMKMLREIPAPHGGIVKKIYVEVGDSIDAEDLLMVVERTDE